jgi:hypothetical protein
MCCCLGLWVGFQADQVRVAKPISRGGELRIPRADAGEADAH